MRPLQDKKWMDDDEPSPREKREMIERGEWTEEKARNKTPLVFRILAWSSVAVIFFAVGYGMMSLGFKWLDKRAYQNGEARSPANLVNTPEEARRITSAEPQPGGAVARQAGSAQAAGQDGYVAMTISIPEGKVFKTRQIRCSGALPEDKMKQTLIAYMDAVKESQMLGAGVQELNIFQSGDWLYLNMNGAFLESIKTLGEEKSRIMLTGMVKTMTDNFRPVNKIKFYVEGKEVRDKKPVDLTAPWGISARSS